MEIHGKGLEWENEATRDNPERCRLVLKVEITGSGELEVAGGEGQTARQHQQPPQASSYFCMLWVQCLASQKSRKTQTQSHSHTEGGKSTDAP